MPGNAGKKLCLIFFEFWQGYFIATLRLERGV